MWNIAPGIFNPHDLLNDTVIQALFSFYEFLTSLNAVVVRLPDGLWLKCYKNEGHYNECMIQWPCLCKRDIIIVHSQFNYYSPPSLGTER